MNRTDRLYAIVEELRARSPRPVSGRVLAERFEVTTRTIERDVLALQEAGVPIFAEPGRTGGYVLDAVRTLPPVNFTPAEAAAIAVALNTRGATPFTASARAALTKVLAAMSEADAAAARDLGGRILVFSPPDDQEPRPVVPHVIEQAIVERRVLRVAYRDKTGAATTREIEPLAIVGVAPNWYLSAWCRLREAVRAFRLDRITDATLTRELAPARRPSTVGDPRPRRPPRDLRITRVTRSGRAFAKHRQGVVATLVEARRDPTRR